MDEVVAPVFQERLEEQPLAVRVAEDPAHIVWLLTVIGVPEV